MFESLYQGSSIRVSYANERNPTRWCHLSRFKDRFLYRYASENGLVCELKQIYSHVYGVCMMCTFDGDVSMIRVVHVLFFPPEPNSETPQHYRAPTGPTMYGAHCVCVPFFST